MCSIISPLSFRLLECLFSNFIMRFFKDAIKRFILSIIMFYQGQWNIILNRHVSFVDQMNNFVQKADVAI